MSGFLGAKDFGFLGGGGGSYISGYYGSFYDTTTQNASINTPTAMKLNTTDFASGFVIENNTLGLPTRIKSLFGGKYNLQFSAQINRTSGGTQKQIDICTRVSENNIAWSNTAVSIQANSNKLVTAWNWFVELNPNQYVEIIWNQDDAIELLAIPEDLITPHPATPSVIATIVQI